MQGVTDKKKGTIIAERIFAEAPKCGFKDYPARKLGKFTHVTGRHRMMSEAEDAELEDLRAEVKKALADVYPKLEKLARVLKPLCV